MAIKFNKNRENLEYLKTEIEKIIRKLKLKIRNYEEKIIILKNRVKDLYKSDKEQMIRKVLLQIILYRKKIFKYQGLISNLEKNLEEIKSLFVSEMINNVNVDYFNKINYALKESTEKSSEEEIDAKIFSEIENQVDIVEDYENDINILKKEILMEMSSGAEPPDDLEERKKKLRKEIGDIKEELGFEYELPSAGGIPMPQSPQIEGAKGQPKKSDKTEGEKRRPKTIERYGDIIADNEMELNKETKIMVSIKKEAKSVLGVKVQMSITVPEEEKKLPEIEIFIMAPDFEIPEPRKKLVIPLDRDSEILEFKITPKEVGKKYIFVEFYQEGKMINRAILEVIVKKETNSINKIEKSFNITMFENVEIDATLRIIRYENKFIFSLFTKHGGTIIDPRASFGTMEIKKKYIKNLNELMRDMALDFKNPKKAMNIIKKLGKLVYQLIPGPMREAIKKIDPKYLIFETGDLFVPFELAHDGEDFICLKYCIGKRILDENKDFSAPPICFGTSEFDFMMVESNPNKDLELKDREYIEKIIKNYDINFKTLKDKNATKKLILDLIKSTPIEIIHFAGHGMFDEKNPDNSGILLEDGILTAHEIRNMKIKGFPLIFANACESASITKVNKIKGVGGVARSFLGSGAIGFIGPLWEITDDLAAEFAMKFYEKLLIDRLTVGDAIKEVKIELKSKYSDILWATFNYYGDPTLKLCPKSLA
ncbi:MAG: CHAT domain-containing protein [Candidatus Helarchaeota archaeon]